MENHTVDAWRTNGFVVLPGYLSAEDPAIAYMAWAPAEDARMIFASHSPEISQATFSQHPNGLSLTFPQVTGAP